MSVVGKLLNTNSSKPGKPMDLSRSRDGNGHFWENKQKIGVQKQKPSTQ